MMRWLDMGGGLGFGVVALVGGCVQVMEPLAESDEEIAESATTGGVPGSTGPVTGWGSGSTSGSPAAGGDTGAVDAGPNGWSTCGSTGGEGAVDVGLNGGGTGGSTGGTGVPDAGPSGWSSCGSTGGEGVVDAGPNSADPANVDPGGEICLRDNDTGEIHCGTVVGLEPAPCASPDDVMGHAAAPCDDPGITWDAGP